MHKHLQARWERERSFHDLLAADLDPAEPPPAEPNVYDQAILNAAGIQAGMRVLDIGSGHGDLTLALLARGARVTGVDLSEGMVALARERVARHGQGQEATFLVAPIESTDLPSHVFDVAVGRWILHHVDLSAAAIELARVLVPGGRLVVLENSGANPILSFARRHVAGRFGIPRFGTRDERPLVREDWESLAVSFASVRPAYPIFEFFELLNRQVFRYRSRRMNDWCNRLDRRLGCVLRLRKYSFRVLVIAVAPVASAGESAPLTRSSPSRRHRSLPVYVARRITYKLHKLRNPREPWLASEAISFLDRALPRAGVGFEWGSGRSTQWLGRRLARLVSIEMDRGWYERVTAEVEGMPSVDLRYIALEHPLEEPTWPQYDPLPRYVAVIGEFPKASLDLVLVDGHYRQACVLAAIDKIRPGGLLVIDNTDWLPEEEWGVPPDWERVHRSTSVVTETTIWRKTT